MNSNNISKCFDDEPIQWGLRGDPFLWNEMKRSVEFEHFPATSNDLRKILNKLFKELTGEYPQEGKDIFVKRYDSGGMSGGWVNSDFWINKGFPLIIQRFEASLTQK